MVGFEPTAPGIGRSYGFKDRCDRPLCHAPTKAEAASQGAAFSFLMVPASAILAAQRRSARPERRVRLLPDQRAEGQG